ncbi:hypothetical protein SCP_0307590 [Sparassis crispa]|uniref:Uncharacterized protein n=1 Tax=Sparassis crispa TaxID=139825 RepID=A0A401GFS2_9APHY|nr:hypothetical protein SCP_0307590 [Sparassis crispa]GBE81036.1 hypothetical protein SCP_0307590 [Sparassis crispa]
MAPSTALCTPAFVRTRPYQRTPTLSYAPPCTRVLTVAALTMPGPHSGRLTRPHTGCGRHSVISTFAVQAIHPDVRCMVASSATLHSPSPSPSPQLRIERKCLVAQRIPDDDDKNSIASNTGPKPTARTSLPAHCRPLSVPYPSSRI